MDNANAKVTPGKEAVDPAYQKALEQQNMKEAEEAAKHGNSAIGGIVLLGLGGGLGLQLARRWRLSRISKQTEKP